MKKIASTVMVAALTATSLMAADAAITAVNVTGDLSRVNHKSDVWKRAIFSQIILSPQTTIRMNDRKANALNADNRAKKVDVAAVYNDETIAFMIKWADGTVNIQSGNSTDRYADGFALQFASDFSNPDRLPYIGMGSQGRQAVIHLQKAQKGVYEPDGKGNVYYQINRNQTEHFGKDLAKFDKKVKQIGSNDYERTFVSEGFRSMTEIKDGSNRSYARLGYKSNGWMGTLARAMQDEYVALNAGAIPVAFAVWDGAKMGRDGLKLLSPWVSVKLQGKEGGEALIDALGNQVEGDVEKGKEAVAANGCIGCHQIKATDAPNLMAPSLSTIGGIATAGYLRESLVDPSAAIVPGYNRNAHSNTPWYTEDNGERVSAMTSYSWLDAETMENILAYLQSLKAEVE